MTTRRALLFGTPTRRSEHWSADRALSSYDVERVHLDRLGQAGALGGGWPRYRSSDAAPIWVSPDPIVVLDAHQSAFRSIDRV